MSTVVTNVRKNRGSFWAVVIAGEGQSLRSQDWRLSNERSLGPSGQMRASRLPRLPRRRP